MPGVTEHLRPGGWGKGLLSPRTEGPPDVEDKAPESLIYGSWGMGVCEMCGRDTWITKLGQDIKVFQI